MLLGTLGASLLGNILSGRGKIKKRQGMNRANEGVIAPLKKTKNYFDAASSFN